MNDDSRTTYPYNYGVMVGASENVVFELRRIAADLDAAGFPTDAAERIRECSYTLTKAVDRTQDALAAGRR